MISSVGIVGAGLAGATFAASLRTHGFDGEIVLYGDEPQLPYERPPLSKDVLLAPKPTPPLVMPEVFYSDQNITLQLGVPVTSVDDVAGGVSVKLADGRAAQHDEVIIATGLRPRSQSWESPDVLTLHRWEDALALRQHLDAKSRLVVVGAGLIGTEVAWAARERGCEVVVLERGATPFGFVQANTQRLRLLHAANQAGIRFKCDLDVVSVNTGNDGVQVRTDSDDVEGDVVLLALGSEPHPLGSGMHGANGIPVDDEYRTRRAGVRAIGDIACRPGVAGTGRVEHWDVARTDADKCARAMLGLDPALAQVTWYWSVQGPLRFEGVGSPRTADDSWDTVDGTMTVHLAGDRVVGAEGIDCMRAMREVRRALSKAGSAGLSDRDLRDLISQPANKARAVTA